MKVDIYITIDSLVPKRTKKRYACLLKCTLRNGEDHKRTYFGEVTGTYHHAVLTAIIAALKELNKKCDVNLYVNDGHVTGNIRNFLETWAQKGFQTSKGKAVVNMAEWQQLWKLVKQHKVTPVQGIHEYENDLNTASCHLWCGFICPLSLVRHGNLYAEQG